MDLGYSLSGACLEIGHKGQIFKLFLNGKCFAHV